MAIRLDNSRSRPRGVIQPRADMRTEPMRYRIPYRRHLTGAITAAVLIANVPTAAAQFMLGQSRMASRIDEAVKALGRLPRLTGISLQAKRRLVEFIMGNTLFVITHEMGHGVINEMNMPVLGREEDAADSFAVVTTLQMTSGLSDRVLVEAAMGWILAGDRVRRQRQPLAFYDEHGLDLQRAYNIVCFMVGSDREKYKQLAEDTKLPEERQESCVWDWKNTAWSWDEMLKKHLRSADQPKIAVTVTYEEDEQHAAQIQVLRHTRLLEAFAEHAADRYAWPKPFTIEARSCGEPNARWKKRVLTLCYELAHEFIELFVAYSGALPRKYRSAAE